MGEFTEEKKAILFASWNAQVGGNMPEIVMESFMFSHPQSMQPEPEFEEDGVTIASPGHPVTWSVDGLNYVASIEGMLGSFDLVTISPTGVRIKEVRQMAQLYIPEKIKNCILAICPNWLTSTPSGAIYHSPVTKVVRTTDNNGNPNANYWDATYVEDWDITFDDPSITIERIKSLPEYLDYKTITFDKYGNVV